MKKFFLLVAAVTIALSGCAKLEESIESIENRVDVLENTTIPSIEEQIETLNLVTAELEKVDDELQKALNALKSDVQANAKDIAALEAQAEALGTRITALNNYVDSEIKKAKDAAAAAYATIDALNNAKSELSALQTTVTNLSTELNAKIDTAVASLSSQIDQAVKTLNDKIADLEARLEVVEGKVDNLLSRIQSLTYLPAYSDGVTTINHIGHLSEVTLDFKVSPKECAEELAKVWQTAVSCEALYTKTRAASLVKMPATAFEVTDAENGVITITASGENLSQEFFAGAQEAKVALVISDGNNSITSDYIPMIAKEVTNEIWYTSTDGNIVTPRSGEEVNDFRTIESLFGASLVSNTYENGVGRMVFDGPVTLIGKAAFRSIDNLETITLPNGIKKLGGYAFHGNDYLKSIKLPDYLEEIYQDAFHLCKAITELTLPDSVTRIGDEAFFNCSKLEYIYSKFSTPDNMALVINGTLNWVSRNYPAGDYKIPDGVTKIQNSAIGYPNNVITVTIPESVETFSSHSFMGAYNISAFYGKYVVDNRHVIKDNILYGAAVNGLTEYEIPEGVTGTDYRLLRSCKFTNVTLPASLEKIGNNFFESCNKLQVVYCKAIVPPAQGTDYNIFLYCSKIPTIYVPRASVEAYKTATGWSQYADKIVGYDF